MTTAEILAKLPDTVRAKVEQWINLAISITDEEVEKMAAYMMSEDYRAAYKIAVSRMTASELDAAMEITNQRQKAATGRVLNNKGMQKAIVLDIFFAFWQIAKTGLMMAK